MLNDTSIKILLAWEGLFIFLLFLLLSPFGIVIWSDFTQFKLIFLFCISGSFIGAIHIYLLQNVIIKRFTILSTISWLLWITLVIGFANFIVYMVYINKGIFLWKYLPNLLLSTFMLALIPTTLIILLYNTHYLKRKIRVVNQINSDLTKYQSRIATKSDLTLTSTNLREVFTIDSNSLLYMASADNYVEMYWLENEQIKKILLRKTLTEIEKEIKGQWQHIKRCHNSYIVNLNQIKSISGNSGGYRIIFNGIDSQIPISKKYNNILQML